MLTITLTVTGLIPFDVEDFEETHQPISTMAQALLDAVNKALWLLAPDELAFCKVLEEQLGGASPIWHAHQHKRLDVSTVCTSIRALIDAPHLPTLDALMNSTPQCMLMNDDDNSNNWSLFAADGSSNEQSILRNEINRLEGEFEKLEAELAAQSGYNDGDITVA